MTITDSMVLQFRSIGKVPRTTVPPAVYSQRFPNMDRPMRLIVLSLSLLLSAVSAAPLMAAETAPPAAASPLVIGETFTIESKALGETRRINVYRPQPWALDPKAPLPVLGGSAYRAFLREELMPQVRQRYPTTDERALIGESLAGLFVVETLLQEPTLFNSYIALDPSLWWNRGAMLAGAAKQLPAVMRAQPRVFLASSGQPELAASTARLAELLQQASPSPLVKYLPLPEETHATIYHPAALQALRTLFPAPPASP